VSRRIAPVSRLFVANRGEIAVRIIRAARTLGIETVVGVSTADRQSLAARLADRAVCIGPPSATESYLNIGVLVTAAKGTGCDALHPGYGFLSERAELPEACEAEGVTFVGPRADLIRDLGDKVRARQLAEKAGLPVFSGSPPTADAGEAVGMAADVGFPMLMKAVAGGGGRGMQLVRTEAELRSRFDTASTEAREAFGDGRLYLERYVEHARHVEVQLVADRHGRVAHLGERDCSIQRRHQKLIEEAPAADVPAEVRAQMREAAVAFGESVGYDDVGTVELLYDLDREQFSFLEMNTRVQVEHPVTEMVTGVDIVATQIRLAGGEPLPEMDPTPVGHSIECRITAESGARGFLPVPGRITAWDEPQGEGIRVDTHCFPGAEVSPYYDSLLAKLIVHGRDRTDAADRMTAALDRFHVEGVPTTIDVHRFILDHPDYRAGRVTTRWVEEGGLDGYLQAAAQVRQS
jgi:acetyl-CoA carboxylase, biotin carboxylase subunit